MGKKKGEGNPNHSEPKEGRNLLGAPTFEQLENGRLKCVETGHELPVHARASYADAKHCRLGLIDAAIALKKPPLNMFKQDPASSSKLICKLTGVTINKTEEHVWNHINGKRFLNALELKESGKEIPKGEKKEEKSDDGGLKGKEKKKKKKKIKFKNEEECDVDEIMNEVRGPTGDSEDEDDFWMPPAGQRWDHDDGGDRWDSESDSDDDSGEEEGSEQKKRRLKADSEVPRMSPSMRSHLESLANLKGEQVAARITQEEDGKDEWFVVKVIHFDRETRQFEVLDEEPGDDEESNGQRKYKLPMSHIIPFPKRNEHSSVLDFPPGKHVLAVYPETTALYKATVVQARKRKIDDYVLEFDDDEEDGSLPQRSVPFHRVVPLPEGCRL